VISGRPTGRCRCLIAVRSLPFPPGPGSRGDYKQQQQNGRERHQYGEIVGLASRAHHILGLPETTVLTGRTGFRYGRPPILIGLPCKLHLPQGSYCAAVDYLCCEPSEELSGSARSSNQNDRRATRRQRALARCRLKQTLPARLGADLRDPSTGQRLLWSAKQCLICELSWRSSGPANTMRSAPSFLIK